MTPTPPQGRSRRASRLAVLLLPAALVVPAAGCEGPPGEDRLDVAERAPAPERAPRGGPEPAPSEAFESPAPAALVPAEIYYDLTEFDWYRRGEPLVHGERDYQPTGRPFSVPAEQLRPAGEYMGVNYYIREEALPAPTPPDTVFVPVFDGYWLPFAARPAPGGGS